MVRKEIPLYLFIGQDSFSKDLKLKQLKQEFLKRGFEYFNLDILYARDLKLADLQERILSLPFKTQKRIIVIKEAQGLKEEERDFLLSYTRKPDDGILLILDFSHSGPKDEFINNISRYARVFRFAEPARLDTFLLSRQIEAGKPNYALKTLSLLLERGEKPERILGGLRYALEKDISGAIITKKRLRLLLHCDIQIKTGMLKPAFALEGLIISLCGTGKSFR